MALLKERPSPRKEKPSPREHILAFPLPRFLALKSEANNKYLRIDDIQNDVGILRFSADEVVIPPYTKFQVEEAASSSPERTLVHIRSWYNNKYWRRKVDDNSDRRIVAEADEPQEDQNLWSCTLFEPEFVLHKDHVTIYRFLHVQLHQYLRIFPEGECLIVSPEKPSQKIIKKGQETPDNRNSDVFNFGVINWDEFVIFPKNVAFKGDNGRYLSTQFIDGNPYLQFSVTESTHPAVENEVTTLNDGSLLIKSTHNQGIWWRNNDDSNNIWAGSNDETNLKSNALFWPVKVDATDVEVVVALLNLGNKIFCERYTNDYLNAGHPIDNPEAHAHLLVVKELVLSRTIYDLKFNTEDARIHDRSIQIMATGKFDNFTEKQVTATIQLSYVDKRDSTWITTSDDVDFTSLILTTLTSDTLFLLDGGRIGVSGNYNGPYKWGQHIISQTTIESPFEVDVMPRSRVTVNLLATEGSCDIPFNYSQKDTLISQRTITYHEGVGKYTGVSFYNFQHSIEVVPL